MGTEKFLVLFLKKRPMELRNMELPYKPPFSRSRLVIVL